MGEAAAVVGIVRGRRGNWLWSRPEANRRQSDLDEWKREEFFDVLMMQADEARTRVREGTNWQGMPLLGASPSLGQMSFVRPQNPSFGQQSKGRKVVVISKPPSGQPQEPGSVDILGYKAGSRMVLILPLGRSGRRRGGETNAQEGFTIKRSKWFIL